MQRRRREAVEIARAIVYGLTSMVLMLLPTLYHFPKESLHAAGITLGALCVVEVGFAVYHSFIGRQ